MYPFFAPGEVWKLSSLSLSTWVREMLILVSSIVHLHHEQENTLFWVSVLEDYLFLQHNLVYPEKYGVRIKTSIFSL